jgi:hypothetical protein
LAGEGEDAGLQPKNAHRVHKKATSRVAVLFGGEGRMRAAYILAKLILKNIFPSVYQKPQNPGLTGIFFA